MEIEEEEAAAGEEKVVFLTMGHDLSLLYQEEMGAALLASGGKGKERKAKGAGREETAPSLAEMLTGLMEMGRLPAGGSCDAFLALDAMMEAEGEEGGGGGGGPPWAYAWGPPQRGLRRIWAIKEGDATGPATTGAPPPGIAAAPALLPAGTLLLDRTFLLFCVGRAAHAAEAYAAVLGGKEAPRARELLRSVATYQFRWGLDPGPTKAEPAPQWEARWRALCLDNVGREVTQLLVRRQLEAEKEGEGEEWEFRVLRLERQHVEEEEEEEEEEDERLLRIFFRFLAYWRQPAAPSQGAPEGKARGGGGAKRGRSMAEGLDEADEALLAAHRHRGGRLFLHSGMVHDYLRRWWPQLGGGEGLEEEERAGKSEGAEEKKARVFPVAPLDRFY